MSLDSLPPIAPLPSTDNSKLDLVVVLAVSRMDWHLAVKWLALAAYYHSRDGVSVPIVVLMSQSLTGRERGILQTACGYEDFEMHVNFVVADINEIGYFGSANQMFKTGLDHCETRYPGKAMLWAEADTVPMHANWIDRIREEYRACGKPFMGDVHLCEVNHMTGNAVYHPDAKKYAPSLALLPGPELTIGWDSQCAHETFPQCHVSKTIQQIWRPAKIDAEFFEKKIRPECALFHQDKTGTLIDLICDREKILRFGNYPQLMKSTYDQASFLGATSVWPANNPQMDILVVCHWRDIEYLRYLVRSIQRFCTGFNGVTICVPSSENDGRYKWLSDGFRVHYYEETAGTGFLQHMVMKCSADAICPGADLILHLDADCMFMSDCNPGDFLTADFKPVLYREKYAGLPNTNRKYWQSTVKAATGLDPVWETMVRHPAVHRKETYQFLRAQVQQHTGREFSEYVMSGQNKFPQSFCEFNSLGAIAELITPLSYSFVEYDRNLDGLETATNPGESNWQYIYRQGRDKVVEFYSLHDVRKYWPDMDAILARKPKPFFVK